MHGDEAQLSQSSVCRVIKAVSEAIAARRRQFMKFPTTAQEKEREQQQFYRYCRFPGVLGAIDGTHVYIRSPGGDQAQYFINRKNRYSVNVQVRKYLLYICYTSTVGAMELVEGYMPHFISIYLLHVGV